MENERIRELDAFRGIAALGVCVFHLTMRYSIAGKYFFSMGCMGVDMFFIVSGFVIFMTVEKSKSWETFAWNRFARLYPAYWFCVTLTAILFVVKNKFLIPDTNHQVTSHFFIRYLANMTMFQHYFKQGDIDSPYWTLIIEIVFYIFIAIMLITRKLKYISEVGFVLALFSACYSFNFISTNNFFIKMTVALPLINYFPLFFAGIILYKMKFEKVTAIRLGLYIATLIFQCMLFSHCYRNNDVIDIYQYTGGLLFIYSSFLLLLFGKLRFLLNPVNLWLGKISYSLYLFHQFIGIDILMPGLMIYLKLNFWISACMSLIILLILATLINKYIEIPGRNYLKLIGPFAGKG